MALFTLASLTPALLLVLASLLGGGWVALAVLVITLGTYLLDRLIPITPRNRAEAEFPSGNLLSAVLALLHLPLLALAVWSIGGGSGWGIWERLGLVVGYGLFFGQVAHPNAHELIHRGNRWLFRLGKMVYASLLIGHHVSAHPLVHHVEVGTDRDPSSARAGEGFWRFAPRCWWGGFRAGLWAENSRRARRAAARPDQIGGVGGWLGHPYLHYMVIALLTLAAAALLAGFGGALALLAVAGYAQIQMMLSDYVQHYGLRRGLNAAGKPLPVSAAHSWNTPHWYSSAMMLNAPRHSDHHISPTRPYPGLRLSEDMPLLPYPLPMMAVIALWPGLWRRVMDPRLAALG